MSQTQLQSEEPEVETEDAPEAEATESQEEIAPVGHNEPPKEEFDPKERVEITDPKVQRKFNDIYKQMKMSDARNKLLLDMNQKALSELDELRSRFQQTDHAEAERILTSRLKEARDSGDEEKADKILQEIIDFRVDSKIKAKIDQPKPIARDPSDEADARMVVQYAQETDARGNLLRPWIDDRHPDHANAMKLVAAKALEVNAELGRVDIGEVMIRMDEAMKPKARAQQGNSRAPDPMRGNLTNTPPRGKMKLSSGEMEALNKLNRSLPSNQQIKPEDYLKWK